MALGPILEPFFEWLQEWANVISGIGSLALSGGLLYLYFQQTGILGEQRELFTHQLNREYRQQHTETLRELVEKWHGDVNMTSKDVDFEDSTNFPTVHLTRVEPAPNDSFFRVREPEFRVIPQSLEDDRYMIDLLENHAPELKKLKEEIEGTYNEFSILKQRFTENSPKSEKHETSGYKVYPINGCFEEWLFNQIVSLERRDDCDKNDLIRWAESGVDKPGSIHPEQGTVSYHGSAGSSSHVYKCKVKSDDIEDYNKNKEEIDEQILGSLVAAIQDISEEEPYNTARDAATKLDELDELIADLDKTLIEYAGRPIYLGDCMYLDEAIV